MEQPYFKINEEYKRSDIHDRYLGQEQGGISTPAKLPWIFVFSGKAGHKYGYFDKWLNKDVFSYYGQGRIGDMVFKSSNLALKEHKANGKRIFLFTETKRSHVKYEGEVEYEGFLYEKGKDENGNERIAINFLLKKIGSKLKYETELESDVKNQLPPADGSQETPTPTEREGLVISRVGQGAYRKKILIRWEYKCAVTDYHTGPILIASHIVPWKDSTDFERRDVHNGILLSPTYDALFDKHLISFEDNGEVILSDLLTKTDYKKIGVSGTEKIKNLSVENCYYLKRHREKLRR